MVSKQQLILFTAITAAVGIGIGVVIGYFSRGETYAPIETPEADPNVGGKILQEISNIEIEENLRILTENPHIAGRTVDEVNLVNFITTRFEEAGLTVETHPYDVLLSYPDDADSNYVAIQTIDGLLVDKSQPKEAILDPSQDKPGVVNPFNAYAKSGNPEGDLVYVNYGRIEDFMHINEKINLTGKICMARYSKIFRGDKSLHAEQYKCAGLILYSDPQDYAIPGKGVYPDDWYLPGTGAQRGTLYKNNGDPLTIHYPSIDTAWRRHVDDAQLPNIPVTPIGYDDAVKYLSKMDGEPVPQEWKGDLNITYRYGPGFIGDHATSKMKMHVTTRNQREVTRNVIGYIRGYVEPDRYVILGNHRDAWVFGAIDPSSGTASMLEVVRAIGEAVKDGWRPRRTIMFCSWGAEEYALIGSAEWVEEFQKVLTTRTTLYINVDASVNGDYLVVGGSTSLNEALIEATKLVPNPNKDEVDAGRTTAYDTWFKNNGNQVPRMNTVGSGSDFTLFLQLTGIAVVDIFYGMDPAYEIGYPVYHSVYETFDLVKAFLDPEFKYHQSASRILAELTRNVADSPLLPFNIVDYVDKITMDANKMLDEFGESMRNYGKIDTDELPKAMTNLSSAANSLHERLDKLDMKNTLALRAANDQLMLFERAFIDKIGITGRDQESHVIYAPSIHNSYGGAAFPGLIDSMFEIGDSSDPQWEEVRRQFSIILYHIGSAASTLEDVTPFRGYSNKYSSYTAK